MFINQQESSKKDYYEKMLKVMGSLSRLYSESNEPYLHYRVAENLFCKSFNADNLSRSDTSADASYKGIGFGIKTFGEKRGNSMEKVAEFNAKSSSFKNFKSNEDLVKEISRLRNERIETTMKIYALEQMMYHCITRTRGRMHVIETPMHLIDVDSIKIISADDTSIYFKDKHEEYSFNFSKSTLYKRFLIQNTLTEIDVLILEDPFDFLEKLTTKESEVVKDVVFAPVEPEYPHVYLPLYSTRSGENKEVALGSGLNQWNAGGRNRKMDEVYIPIPAWVHKEYPDFFPEVDTPFNLSLPNKKNMSAKVCQQGKKALMSNPNTALGEWILRDVLGLDEGEVLTYKKLEDIGLDSVVIYKISEGEYKIDFAKVDSYDDFESENNN